MREEGVWFGAQPVGFALFGCNRDGALVGQDRVGHHQQGASGVFRFDLLPSSGSLRRRAQEPGQASGFHVVHTGPAGQPGDDVDGRSAAQAVVTAGGRSGWGQSL